MASGAEYPIARITIDYLGVRQAVDESKRALQELVDSSRASASAVRDDAKAFGELTGDSAATAQALATLRSQLDTVATGMTAAGRAGPRRARRHGRGVEGRERGG
jgi:hypothetical protein